MRNSVLLLVSFCPLMVMGQSFGQSAHGISELSGRRFSFDRPPFFMQSWTNGAETHLRLPFAEINAVSICPYVVVLGTLSLWKSLPRFFSRRKSASK